MGEEGRVIFWIMPEGAQIYLNNKYMGQTPLDLTLPVGDYKAKAQYKNCLPKEWVINVSGRFPPPQYVFALRCPPGIYI